MSLTRTTALDGEAILPLADCKLHLKVETEDEDALIADIRDAAILHIERVSGVILAPSDFRWTMRRFAARVDLPNGPATALGEVTYHDELGEAATYTGARLVDGAVYPAVGEIWPYANGYAAVNYTAGLASPDDAPQLLAAVKLLLGHWYANREAVNEGASNTVLPLGVDALVQTSLKILV